MNYIPIIGKLIDAGLSQEELEWAMAAFEFAGPLSTAFLKANVVRYLSNEHFIAKTCLEDHGTMAQALIDHVKEHIVDGLAEALAKDGAIAWGIIDGERDERHIGALCAIFPVATQAEPHRCPLPKLTDVLPTTFGRGIR